MGWGASTVNVDDPFGRWFEMGFAGCQGRGRQLRSGKMTCSQCREGNSPEPYLAILEEVPAGQVLKMCFVSAEGFLDHGF